MEFGKWNCFELGIRSEELGIVKKTVKHGSGDESRTAESGVIFYTLASMFADFFRGSGFAAADKSRNTNEVYPRE